MHFDRRQTGFPALALGLFVFGLVASILAGFAVASRHLSANRRWLEERSEAVATSIEATVKTAVDGLRALGAFVENSEEVTPDEFSGFVGSLDPAISLIGVAYTPLVADTELEAYVAGKRRGNADFAITAFGEDGALHPLAGGRSVYYPIELFHTGPLLLSAVEESPASISALSIGFDAGSTKEWRETLHLSATGDLPVVSDVLEVAGGETVVGNAFIVSVPVHDDAGVVVGLLAAPMIDAVLADRAVTSGVTWVVGSPDGDMMRIQNGREVTIQLPGNEWALAVAPADSSSLAAASIPAGLVTLGGVVISILVTFVFVLAGQRSRARRRMEDMERLAEVKDGFLASVSHEIRTPLSVVAGLAHELQDRPGDFDAGEFAELLEIIARQSDEVAFIVEDLLVAARADIGSLRIFPEVIDLAAEARDVVHSAGVRIPVEGGEAQAWADPVRVRQIVRNLVSNAERYGGPVIQMRVASFGDHAFLEVRDSGPPIPIDQREEIFAAYVTSTGTSAPEVSSIGLGLKVSRRLAELLGGGLTYHHDGTWSVFRLELGAAADGTAPSDAIDRATAAMPR